MTSASHSSWVRLRIRFDIGFADVSRASWVANCSVQVGWERVPSGLGGNAKELGGNVSHQSWVGMCPVRVGWESVPCKLGGNVWHRRRIRFGIGFAE